MNKRIQSETVVSAPGAAITVTCLELTDEAKKALTTRVGYLPGITTNYEEIPMQGKASWINDALVMLDVMLTMPQNWDSYGADPPNAVAVENARKWLLDDSCDPDVQPYIIPIASGGVQLQWNIFTDGEVGFLFHNDGSTSTYIF